MEEKQEQLRLHIHFFYIVQQQRRSHFKLSLCAMMLEMFITKKLNDVQSTELHNNIQLTFDAITFKDLYNLYNHIQVNSLK